MKPTAFLAISLLILSLIWQPCQTKVSVKAVFPGINAQSQTSPVGWPLGVKVDLDQIFDLSEAKNPKFTVKNPSHGIIVDANTVLSQTVILDRTSNLARSIRNYIAIFSQNNQLVLVETKIGGFFGDTTTLNLFDPDQTLNAGQNIVCYDMIYLRNFDSMVLGCLDDPQTATT